ncbi:hypothetical protein Bca4012_093878 [Brassica carinata]
MRNIFLVGEAPPDKMQKKPFKEETEKPQFEIFPQRFSFYRMKSSLILLCTSKKEYCDIDRLVCVSVLVCVSFQFFFKIKADNVCS